MDEQGLRTLLEELQKELDKIEDIDEKGRELLLHLDAEIHELLQRSTTDNPLPRPSTIQRFTDSIDYFEVIHPTLSATLIKLLGILSNAGI
jgi:hypothetical protein